MNTMATKTRRHEGRFLLMSLVVLAGLALTVERGEAHKPITSKYTYNDDVFPIVRDRCGRCHVTGGVAPMSLMTYKDAFPWAESIRTELIAGNMPPWNAEDGVGDVRHAQTMTAREIDRKSTRLNSSHSDRSRMPSSA